MIKTPSKVTLRKYGLSEQEWESILKSQGGVCFVCEKEPSTGRLVTDHFHVKNWKKMPPEQRKLYVRGILCFWCNHAYLGRGITVEKARRTVIYLENFEKKRQSIIAEKVQ